MQWNLSRPFSQSESRAAQYLNFSCIDKAMEQLSIPKSYPIDRKIIADIFKNDMQLSDLRPMKEILEMKLKDKDGVSKLISKLGYSLVTKHPAIVEFLCEADKKNLLNRRI